MKRIAILGSTGSVGVQALQLIANRRDTFGVAALTARRSAEPLMQQTAEFDPAAVCLVDGNGRDPGCPAGTAWFEGADGILEALEAAQPDLTMNLTIVAKTYSHRRLECRRKKLIA